MDLFSALLLAVAWALFVWLLFRMLRRGGWRRATAALFVLALSANPVTLYGVSQGLGPFMLAGALGLLIVAIRRIEIVGDVQSQMTFGILLSLLLLLTPFAFILIPILVFWGPALSKDGRKDWRAFTALLMIGVLPSFILAFGLWQFGSVLPEHAEAMRAGVARFLSRPVTLRELNVAALIVESGLWMIGPILIVQAFWLRGRYVASTVAALAMPLVLYAAALALGAPIDTMQLALAALAVTIAWLATAPAPSRLQVAASVLLLCSGVFGWQILMSAETVAPPAMPLRPSIGII